MLPVVDKPLIQYAVEEAYAAGIRQMIFVNGRNKRAIPDHFDTAYELEAELSRPRGKTELLELVHSMQAGRHGSAFTSASPRPWAWATPCCAPQCVVVNEPFAVLLADDLMVGTPPAPAS
jgi:UTP--glucose-1-phosphate uridylyltransferase